MTYTVAFDYKLIKDPCLKTQV